MTDSPQRRRRHVFGRRVGHRLRPRQQRLLGEMLPRTRIEPGPSPIPDLRLLFPPSCSRIWLEIGFGGGEHLAWQAAANPDVGFIGCEPFVNGVAKLLGEVAERGLVNVRIHDGDARDLLDRLPEASVERVFLLYPDPWPKTRHRKRRFVSTNTIEGIARVLAEDGEFRLSSDIPDYVRWSLVHILPTGLFRWTARCPADWRRRPPDWPQTRYEAKALDAGRTPAYLVFKRCARA